MKTRFIWSYYVLPSTFLILLTQSSRKLDDPAAFPLTLFGAYLSALSHRSYLVSSLSYHHILHLMLLPIYSMALNLNFVYRVSMGGSLVSEIVLPANFMPGCIYDFTSLWRYSCKSAVLLVGLKSNILFSSSLF